MITERWKEEIRLMKNEMERFLNFYSTQVYKTLSDEVLAINEQIESISTVGAYVKLEGRLYKIQSPAINNNRKVGISELLKLCCVQYNDFD